MDTMTNELKVNLEYNWTSDATLPFKPVQEKLLKEDQCIKPECIHDQLTKIPSSEIFIKKFEEKYPTVFKAFRNHQTQQLLEFIQVYIDNHEDSK